MLRALPHKLYVRIYAALLASLVVAGAMFALIHLVYDQGQVRSSFDTFAEVAAEVLPPAAAPLATQQQALQRWSRKVRADMSLYSADGKLIAWAGRLLPPPPQLHGGSTVRHGLPPAFILKLPDGRWLVCRRAHGNRARIDIVMLLTAIAAVVAIGAFPVVRRLTRRLERLQGSVENGARANCRPGWRWRGATKWRAWPPASTKRPGASKRWWGRRKACWPTPRMSCARRWRGSAWLSS